MFHPRVIILPGVIQDHWARWRQDASKNKAFKANRALDWTVDGEKWSNVRFIRKKLE